MDMPPISKYLFPLANVCLTFVMFPPIDSSFNVSQGGEYEYQHLLHAECSLSKPLNSLFVQRLADIHCDYVSSSSSSPPPSTPLLSPTTTSSSSFDSPFGSPTSFSGNNVSTSPDSRSTSPDSPSTPSTAPSILAETTAASGTLASAKDPSHIKRPPNAYMCFRTYFCKNIPHDVERHNATVSKITGMAWNRLSDEERIPYVEQAAVIKAEFMAKHPDWVFKPTPRKEKKKMRRTQTRTLADQQRYMRIAMGFNSGKRGKELKRVAEMTEAAGTEEISTPLAMVRRSRKFTTTKKSSTTPDPVRSVENLSHSADREPQTETHRMSIEFPPSVTTVQVEEMPPSFPQLSLRNEPQSDRDFFDSPSVAHPPDELPDPSSILMAQDAYSLAQVAQQSDFDSLMSQLQELGMDNTSFGLFDGWYQPQFSPTSPRSFEDIMNDFSSGFPPY